MIRLEKLGYLTASEMAEYLGVKRHKIYEWKDKGLLPKPVSVQDAICIWRVSDIKAVMKKLNIKQNWRK